MAPPASQPAGAPQWADQIQRLCALLETITYRVLEVEERLSTLEGQVAEAIDASSEAQEEALAAQLEETARRVARMEAALGGIEAARGLEAIRLEARAGAASGAGSGRRLQALGQSPAWPDADPQEPEADPDPFYDEGEQTFMDERTA